MLAIFEDGTEVLICELDESGDPILAGYFQDDERDQKEYNLRKVDGPIRIERGVLGVEPERTVFDKPSEM